MWIDPFYHSGSGELSLLLNMRGPDTVVNSALVIVGFFICIAILTFGVMEVPKILTSVCFMLNCVVAAFMLQRVTLIFWPELYGLLSSKHTWEDIISYFCKVYAYDV